MKEIEVQSGKKYVLLNTCQNCIQRVFRTTKYRERIAIKITKRKVLIGQACRVASPSHLGESKGRSLDTMFLHTATVAEEVHFIYLLLVVRFKFLHFRSKLSLQLFFLH